MIDNMQGDAAPVDITDDVNPVPQITSAEGTLVVQPPTPETGLKAETTQKSKVDLVREAVEKKIKDYDPANSKEPNQSAFESTEKIGFN